MKLKLVLLFIVVCSIGYYIGRVNQKWDSHNQLSDIRGELDGKIMETKIQELHVEDQLPAKHKKKRLNVLFIITDDMRAQLGCLSGPNLTFTRPLHTPNLDKLASRSLLLNNAFVQYTLCNPSRTSILTSRRPDETKIIDNNYYWRNVGPNFTTLPQYFKEQGYTAIGVGKVFHQGPITNNQDPPSWSTPMVEILNSERAFMRQNNISSWMEVTNEDVKKHNITFMDDYYVNGAKHYLDKFSERSKMGDDTPFFLGLGFRKPHELYFCPKRFYDLYELDLKNQYLIDEELRESEFDDITNKYLRRGYFACISFVDSLIGDVLDYLNKVGLAESTIVSFVSDHGYHHGELGHTHKLTTHDISSRVPMMIHIPGLTDKGQSSEAIVEALDLFPTIVEAAGLPKIPKCPTGIANNKRCVRGVSLLPLINNPKIILKQAALSQAKRHSAMKYSIRTDRYRFSLSGTVTNLAKKNEVDLYELFDHKTDTQERRNVINDIKYKYEVNNLYKLLTKQVAELNPDEEFDFSPPLL